MSRAIAVASIAVVVGCASSKTAVTPSGAELSIAPRPPGCRVEFYRAKPPERPFDEVATLHYESIGGTTVDQAQEAMREKACAVGADAVVVTRDLVLGSMVGVAISYRDAREKHRVDAALRRAAQVEFDKQMAERRRQWPGVPDGFVPARVVAPSLIYALADRRAHVEGDLAPGAEVWVDPKPSDGWRRVFVTAGKRGWIEDGAVEPRVPDEAPGAPAKGEPRPSSSI